MRWLVWVSVCTAVTLSACSRPAPVQEQVRAVKLWQVGAGASGQTQEFAAEIRARTESRLSFRVGGKLIQRPAEVGQRVRVGQVLAVLDAQDYQLAAQAAAAQLHAAQTQRDLAAADLKRFESLREQGFVSSAEIERRQTTLKAADASLRQAQSQAQAQGNQVAYTQLLADAEGVVVAVEAEPGQVLPAGGTVVRVARQGPRDAVLSIPEDQWRAVRLQQKASVVIGSAQGVGAQVLDGQVREIASSADPATRTFTVKVALNGPQDQVPLGATATVRLQPVPAAATASSAGVLVPTTAVWQHGRESAVWVFDAATSTVKSRVVQVAGVQADTLQVVAGLQPGEEVVAAGTHVLVDNMKVTRYQSVTPPAAQHSAGTGGTQR